MIIGAGRGVAVVRVKWATFAHFLPNWLAIDSKKKQPECSTPGRIRQSAVYRFF